MKIEVITPTNRGWAIPEINGDRMLLDVQWKHKPTQEDIDAATEFLRDALGFQVLPPLVIEDDRERELFKRRFLNAESN